MRPYILKGNASVSGAFNASALIEVGCKQPNGTIPLKFEVSVDNWTPKKFPRMTLENGVADFTALWQRSNATHTSGDSFNGYINASLIFQTGEIDGQGLPSAGMPSANTGLFIYAAMSKVGRCRLTVSKPELTARLVSGFSA